MPALQRRRAAAMALMVVRDEAESHVEAKGSDHG
jgi:hypothetical protein